MDGTDDFFDGAGSDTWPFEAAKIANIATAYALGEREVNKLVGAARTFVLSQFSRGKPLHSVRELLRLEAAFVKFRKAIGETGIEARGHLESHRQQAPHGPDFTLASIEHVLWGF